MDVCDKCGLETEYFPKNSNMCFACKKADDRDKEREKILAYYNTERYDACDCDKSRGQGCIKCRKWLW